MFVGVGGTRGTAFSVSLCPAPQPCPEGVQCLGHVTRGQASFSAVGSQMSHVTGPTEAEDLEQSALEASSHAVMSPGGLLDTKEALRCFVHVASKEHLCVRVRTLTVYAEINKMVGEVKVWVGGIPRGIPYTMGGNILLPW